MPEHERPIRDAHRLATTAPRDLGIAIIVVVAAIIFFSPWMR